MKQLLENRVIVKPYPKKEKTDSGLYIPDTAKGRPNTGKVVHVGLGYTIKEGENAGTHIPMNVKVDDEVMFEENDGCDLELNGEKVVMLLEDSIMGII